MVSIEQAGFFFVEERLSAMSLVDATYGSDDDDDVVEAQAEEDEEEKKNGVDLPTMAMPASPVRSEDAPSASAFSPSVVSLPTSSMIGRPTARGVFPQSVRSPTESAPRIRLPDVSDLLGGASDLPTASENLKKRPAASGLASSFPRSKLPRGNLQPSRVAPDTAGGLLTPPQLRGRSNVATEDLDKMFSRRQRR